MQFLVLTGYDQAMADVGRLTSAAMHAYALRHGYAFECVTDYESGTHPSWQKLKLIRERLSSYAAILWLDADVVITNPMFRWPQIGAGEADGVWVSKDWGDSTDPHYFSAGVMIWRNGPRAQALLDTAMEKMQWANRPLWDQSALREVYREDEILRLCIRTLNRRVLNAVPSVLHTDAQEPWQPHDFVCHLTGVKNETRLEWMSAFDAAAVTEMLGHPAPSWYNTRLMMDRRHIACIHELMNTVYPRTALELGMYKGAVSDVLLCGLERGIVSDLTFCDIAWQPEFLERVGSANVKLIKSKSVDLLRAGGNWELVVIDTDHHVTTTAEELRLLLPLNPDIIVLHDVCLGYTDSNAQGPMWAMHHLRDNGWHCVLDYKMRPGENTQRGLCIATKSQAQLKDITYCMQLTCY